MRGPGVVFLVVPPIPGCPSANCTCSEVNVNKQRLVDKSSCSHTSPDSMALLTSFPSPPIPTS